MGKSHQEVCGAAMTRYFLISSGKSPIILNFAKVRNINLENDYLENNTNILNKEYTFIHKIYDINPGDTLELSNISGSTFDAGDQITIYFHNLHMIHIDYHPYLIYQTFYQNQIVNKVY
jgi:hypothetical protein